MIKRLFASIFLFLALSVSVLASQATLTWTPPTLNADGTPLTDLAGFNLYAALQGAAKVIVGTVNSPATFTFVHKFTAAEGSTWCYQATAYDTSNNESAMSNEVCKQFPKVPPAAPVITGVVLAQILNQMTDPEQFVRDNSPSTPSGARNLQVQ